jgi:hypothetical protein
MPFFRAIAYHRRMIRTIAAAFGWAGLAALAFGGMRVEAQAPPQPAPFQAPSVANPTSQYEQPPIVNITKLLPPSAVSGLGFSVQPQVPTNGAMGQYAIVANASVFGNDAGTYYVESLDLLKIRLSEIPAIVQLDKMSTSSLFTNALVSSAEQPVAAAANMVMHPEDTVTGLPSGIGSFFDRVSLGAGQIMSSATSSLGSGQAAGKTGMAAATAFGYDQIRRDLARKLHVDPYTSNPILTKKLNKAAWIMFSGRITVDAAMMAVPASVIISGVTFTNDLVYQTPKADLVLLVQNQLQNMGLSSVETAAFASNTALPLSLQVSAVKDLQALGDIQGRHAAAVEIGNVMTEYQARFLVSSLRMLVQWGEQQSPITRIQNFGVLVGKDKNGTTIVPAPIDYLSWTPRIAGFATAPTLRSMQNRVLLIPPRMTPLAQHQLSANGWNVRSGSQP